MMVITIDRLEQLPDGVFGRMIVGNKLTLYTMEDDWIDNAPRVSCIPAGVYTLHRTVYYKHKIETFEVTDVPGRSRILIHAANTEEDVEGCIGVGLRRKKIKVLKDEDTGRFDVMKEAVVDSKIAFHRFMEAMVGVDEATLSIAWAPGLPKWDLVGSSPA